MEGKPIDLVIWNATDFLTLYFHVLLYLQFINTHLYILSIIHELNENNKKKNAKKKNKNNHPKILQLVFFFQTYIFSTLVCSARE